MHTTNQLKIDAIYGWNNSLMNVHIYNTYLYLDLKKRVSKLRSIYYFCLIFYLKREMSFIEEMKTIFCASACYEGQKKATYNHNLSHIFNKSSII